MSTFNILIWIVFLKALAVLYGYIDKKHSHILSQDKACLNVLEVFDMDLTLEKDVWSNDFCGLS